MKSNPSKSISLACLTALWGLAAMPQSLAACANAQTATAIHWDPVLHQQWLTTTNCSHPERPAQAKLMFTSTSRSRSTQPDKPLAVRAGDRIRLTYHQSTTRMELTGVAEESGAVGSTIHARLAQPTPSANIPEAKAIVRGPSEAELQP